MNNKTILKYGRSQILFAFVLLLFLILSTTSYLILRPVLQYTAQHIALHLAAAYTNNTQNTQPKLETLSATLTPTDSMDHRLSSDKSTQSTSLLPLIHLVRNELSKKLKQPVRIVTIENATEHFWFEVAGNSTKVGFARNLVGTKPEITMLLLALFILALSYLFAFLVSRRLNHPLILLRNTFKKLSGGDFSGRLPRHELAEINEAFQQVNQLSKDFKELLDQRVVFLAGISHDIRTPITRLKLLIALNEKALPRPFLEKTQRSICEIEGLIRIYLDAGQLLVEEQNVMTNARNICEELVESSSLQNSQFVQITAKEDLNFSTNKKALKRVLINLLGNAVKYSGVSKKSPILLTALQQENQSIEIQIVDSGPGIEEQFLEEVYKPFFRPYQSTTSDKTASSSGLGLAICRQICLSQGWSLRLTNQTPPKTGLVTSIIIDNKPMEA